MNVNLPNITCTVRRKVKVNSEVEDIEDEDDDSGSDSDSVDNNVLKWIKNCVMKSTDEGTDMSYCYKHYKKQYNEPKSKKEFVESVCQYFHISKKSKTLPVTIKQTN